MEVLDKLFFQNEVQGVLYKLVLVTYPFDIFVGFTALQTSGLVKKQKNKICSYGITIIMLPKISLEHLELLRP